MIDTDYPMFSVRRTSEGASHVLNVLALKKVQRTSESAMHQESFNSHVGAVGNIGDGIGRGNSGRNRS